MKVFVITASNSTGNIVKNTLTQAKITNLELVVLETPAELEGQLSVDDFILIDWEHSEPGVLGGYVKRAREFSGELNVPIILMATKQQANTTFAGMKAGASAVVTKPLNAEELVKHMAAAQKKAKSKKAPSVNVEFINPFIESTKSVFKTMAGIDAERKKLYLKEDHKMMGDVSGVMGLSGDASGSVVISLPKSLAIGLVAKMLGEEPGTEITPDICDGIGEIINMISGQAKASLTKTKYHFQISIPTVVQGPEHEISHKKGTPNIAVLFEAQGQEFLIQICLSPKEG
ncbi:MAG: chemotaxis protein CheX [Planctomycetota bacterium]|jgi:chemotaxis protein CheX